MTKLNNWIQIIVLIYVGENLEKLYSVPFYLYIYK